MSWKRAGLAALSWRDYRAGRRGGHGPGRPRGRQGRLRGHHGHQPARARPRRPGRRPCRGHPDQLHFTLAAEQLQAAATARPRWPCSRTWATLKRWQDVRDGLPALQHLVLLDGAEETDGPDVLGWDELVRRGREALAADRPFEELRRPGWAEDIVAPPGPPARPRACPSDPPQPALRVRRPPAAEQAPWRAARSPTCPWPTSPSGSCRSTCRWPCGPTSGPARAHPGGRRARG